LDVLENKMKGKPYFMPLCQVEASAGMNYVVGHLNLMEKFVPLKTSVNQGLGKFILQVPIVTSHCSITMG